MCPARRRVCGQRVNPTQYIPGIFIRTTIIVIMTILLSLSGNIRLLQQPDTARGSILGLEREELFPALGTHTVKFKFHSWWVLWQVGQRDYVLGPGPENTTSEPRAQIWRGHASDFPPTGRSSAQGGGCHKMLIPQPFVRCYSLRLCLCGDSGYRGLALNPDPPADQCVTLGHSSAL